MIHDHRKQSRRAEISATTFARHRPGGSPISGMVKSDCHKYPLRIHLHKPEAILPDGTSVATVSRMLNPPVVCHVFAMFF
jgi:hypothetical protein